MGNIVVITHQVGFAKFFKIFLGVISATILVLSLHHMAIGVCSWYGLAHRKGRVQKHPPK